MSERCPSPSSISVVLLWTQSNRSTSFNISYSILQSKQTKLNPSVREKIAFKITLFPLKLLSFFSSPFLSSARADTYNKTHNNLTSILESISRNPKSKQETCTFLKVQKPKNNRNSEWLSTREKYKPFTTY